MGQYFAFVNLDKKEYIYPHDFGHNGAKELEHSYVGNDYVAACVKLIRNRWKGDRVVHIGDYAYELEDNPKFKSILTQIRKENPKLFEKDHHSYYSLVDDENPNAFKKLTPKDIKGTDARYILVDDDLFIDRLNIKYGESPSDRNFAFFRSRDSKTNEEYACLSKIDNFTLAIALGEGSGGSYYFEYGSIQDKMHGSLVGHRFDATNVRPKNRKELDLTAFGYFTIEEVLKDKRCSDFRLLLNEKWTMQILKDDEIKFLQNRFKQLEKESIAKLEVNESTLKNLCKGTNWICTIESTSETKSDKTITFVCGSTSEDVRQTFEFNEDTKINNLLKEIINICQDYDVNDHFRLWYGRNSGEPQDPRELLNDCETLRDDYVALADNARAELSKFEKDKKEVEQDEGPEL